MSDIPSIIITPQSKYLPTQSDPYSQKFVWSYEINILNESEQYIQLLSRYWLITDMSATIEEVRGIGVIGLQPLIKPGQRFIYTSFCQLATPQGIMEGRYDMQTLEKPFEINIPKFILSAPVGITKHYRTKLH